MSKKVQIIKMTEAGAITREIMQATGASLSYISAVRRQLATSGVNVCNQKTREPNRYSVSFVVYKFMLSNPKCRDADAAKKLGVSRALCQKVRKRYLGQENSPKDFKPIKSQILQQRVVMRTVDLSELQL